MINTLRFIAPLAFTVSLAGCSESAPNMSDEQILNLFYGSSMFTMHADAPKTIPKQTEECVRVLSGVDEAIYQDMPSEMIGMFKTTCRQDLSNILSDPVRNPLSLTLVHLEDQNLAERVTAVRKLAEEDYRKFAEEEKRQEEANRLKAKEERRLRKIAEQDAALQDIRAQLEVVRENLPKRLSNLATVCADFDITKEALRRRAPRSPVYNRAWRSMMCASTFEDRANGQLARIEESVSNMVAKENTLFTPSMPYLGDADPERIQVEIERIKALSREMENG